MGINLDSQTDFIIENSLKIFNIDEMLREDSIFDKRPEMLSGKDFIQLAKKIGHGNISN